MTDYIYRWENGSIDGTNAVNGPDGVVNIGVSTPTSASGSDWTVGSTAGVTAVQSSSVTSATEISATFDQPVENICFEVFDVDSGAGWDDKVTIIALDANGNQVPVTFTNTTSAHSVSGNTIEGSGFISGPGVEGPGAADTVTVNIAGPIVSLRIIHDDGNSDPTSGTVGLGAMHFDVAELVGEDGPVDGENFGELMGPGYTDDNAPTTNQGNDFIDGPDGNDDTIFGNGGNDTIDGGLGNDTIIGDGNSTGEASQEYFQWEDAPNFGDNVDAAGFTQNTGSVNVTFAIDSSTSQVDNEYETDAQQTGGLLAGVNNNASFESVLNGDSQSAQYSWATDAPVENVMFRVNDIDGDGRIVVRAFDADGNPISVTLSNAGAGLALSNSDGVPGNDTATSIDNNYTADNAAEHSVLVSIAGPVSRWEIEHQQDGGNNSGINVTDDLL